MTVLAIEMSAAAVIAAPLGWYLIPPRGWKNAGHQPFNYDHIHEMEMEVYGKILTTTDYKNQPLMVPKPPAAETRTRLAKQRERANEEYAERLLRQQKAWNPGPLYPGDTNWTDQDGRPW